MYLSRGEKPPRSWPHPNSSVRNKRLDRPQLAASVIVGVFLLADCFFSRRGGCRLARDKSTIFLFLASLPCCNLLLLFVKLVTPDGSHGLKVLLVALISLCLHSGGHSTLIPPLLASEQPSIALQFLRCALRPSPITPHICWSRDGHTVRVTVRSRR
ncbi:hypothetical protein B0T16DRAFT_51808 [Cercophora newfieldiana]|uniref:Uncharacterized protein n=1 Tax=Cercophora newfieldiana TaxID=92897 RepID=A0AA39YSE0_9PEZI|nr:hypothetical protein B0T16DRAFT_51808 [Cercophora newfieldiana]